MTIKTDPAVVSRGVCHKLECLGDFLTSYTSSIETATYCYLEPFAHYQYVKCRQSGAIISATSLRALEIDPPFGRYVLAGHPGSWPRDFQKPASGVLIEHQNLMYSDTLHRIFDFIPRSSNILAVLDLPGYRHLRWSTMKKLITYSTNWDGYRMDLLVILPVEMALLKNMNRLECSGSISRFFGSHSWQTIASQSKEEPDSRQLRRRTGEIYSAGLSQTGYKYTGGFSPDRFGASLYYVIWASDRHNWLDKLKKIWAKPRFLPGEMFHGK